MIAVGSITANGKVLLSVWELAAQKLIKKTKDNNMNESKTENGQPTLQQHLVTCRCMVCGEEFQGEEPKMCCSGRDCGCIGMPIDPIICSEDCYNKLPFRNGR